MNTINTDLIEKILFLNEKILKYANKKIFNDSWITSSQFNILWEIIVKKRKTINELKQYLIISSPALSQILWRMEDSWLITRNINKNNKREINLTATKKWIDIYNHTNEKYINLVNNSLSDIDLEKKEKTILLLNEIEKIVNNS